MDLSREILTAETRFLRKLGEYFLFVFPENKLESHGLGHHHRVWAYAKELLLYPGTENIPREELLPGKLIIAAYMHDIGMIVDPGPKHGIHSRSLCEKFLLENNLPIGNFKDLLEAVEKHDDKEYITSPVNNPVLQILSVADDLDALGYIGIFRYLEIYLKRGVGYEILGDLINKNIVSRFKNLENIYGDQHGLMARHQPRYEIIINFLNSYNDQLVRYEFGSGTPSGNCGVVEMINKMVQEELTLTEIMIPGENNTDGLIKKFFVELSHELTLPAPAIQE